MPLLTLLKGGEEEFFLLAPLLTPLL